MKKWIILNALIISTILSSCNHSHVDPRHHEDIPASNAVIVPTLMDGTPVPPAADSGLAADAVAGDDNDAGKLDTNAPSDSKGVGKFSAVDIPATVDNTMADQGKQLFQTSCTACHTATDKRLIGPGLQGITKIRTPEWIMNMITNPVEMTHKDPVAMALLAEFNNIQMTDQNISEQDARSILEYLRQNDGVK